jgi:hypothetical protein
MYIPGLGDVTDPSDVSSPTRTSSSSSSGYPSYGSVYQSPRTNPSGVQAGSNTPGLDYNRISNALSAGGLNPSAVNPQTGTNNLLSGFRAYTNYSPSAGSSPTSPLYTSSGGSSGGFGFGGGGGGGGGGGPAGINQAQLDWISDLLARGEPDPLKALMLKLPRFRTKFHPEMYNQLLNRFNRGVAQDTRAANQAYNRLGRTTRNDYVNAFTNPRAQMATMRQAPGMDVKGMARMMQGQGLDPALATQQMAGASAADRAFQNLWGVLGANENLAQRGRLRAVDQDRMDTANAIRAAALQGRTGIGLQRAGAKDEWRTRKEDTNYQRRLQQAMSNWQQRNQVRATNTQNDVSYRNSMIQALIGMIPSLAQGVNLPDVSTLLGMPPAPKKGGARRGGARGGPGRGRLAGGKK